MQTKPIKRQLDSREYKIILKSNEFANKENGKKKVVDMIKLLMEKQKGKFKMDDKKQERKKVWYLDTKKHELYKKNNFLLRIREECDENDEIKGFDVTFKNRIPDKDKAASYDLSISTEKSDIKFEENKFEEDIITPFESKFSTSTKLKSKENPDLKKYKDILDIFPELSLNILENESLLKVNGFEATEISYNLGSIEYHNAMDGRLQIGIWYIDKSPLIAEFGIDVKAKDLTNSNGNQSNEFPQSKIHEIDNFYMTLQKEKSIVDLNTHKTKTQYVYDWKVK